ncbi:MAG: ATP-binding cassette domain-containing protein [Gammaproteobacteria bacterium]|nr:ATP-binding cassette domain-containing protein [Gammaproteobacteria bacterium]MDH3767213.1 ATP-binding cassette domain-containing protein [Gammaproteobacteria bacterium]
MIEAKNLQKSFGPIQAVRDVSFSAADGRITGLLGPNGAGKSTTLRMLYTVLKPDSGQALIDGHSVVAHPLKVRQSIGVLPHSAGLYPNLSARENIRYYAALHGLRGDALDTCVETLLMRLDIVDFADRRAKGFSHGQTTRVALARALVHEPRNILLDEPTTGLDVMATRKLRDLVRQLRDDGRCVLLSSHVMQEVAALCDDIVIINAGMVVAAGSPDQLRAQTGRDDLEDAFVHALGETEAS